MNIVEEQNIKAFSLPAAVIAYSKKYLRSSEEFVINKYMGVGRRVLDVGCGAGRTTYYISKNGAEVIGIDVSAPLINQAKKLYPEIDFRVMNAAKLDFPNDSFDVLFFSFNGLDNIYPLKRRLSVIDEMTRVIRPQGYLIYSSHNSLCIPRNRNGWKILWKNGLRLKTGPHWREGDYGFGTVIQYYNNLWNEQSQLQKIELRVVDVMANGKLKNLPRFLFAFLEKFPMYIVQKQ